MKTLRLRIPSGDAGADVTARALRQLIEHGKRDPRIRQAAVSVLKASDVAAHDRWGEVRALHGWVQRNVRYVQDPHQIEYVQTPRVILDTMTGDCDDYTVFLGALLETVGYPVDIKVVGRDRRRPFHHVYPVVHLDGMEVGLDAAMPVPFGYQASDLQKERFYRSEDKGMKVTDVYSGSGFTALRGFDERQALRDKIGRFIEKYRAEARTAPAHLATVMNADIDELKRRVNKPDLGMGSYREMIAWFLGRVEAWKALGMPALIKQYVASMLESGQLCLMSEVQFVDKFKRVNSASLSVLSAAVRSELFDVLRVLFATEKLRCGDVVSVVDPVPEPSFDPGVPPPIMGGCHGVLWPDIVLRAGQKLTDRCIRERIASDKIKAAPGCVLNVMPTTDAAVHAVVCVATRPGIVQPPPDVVPGPAPSGVARCAWLHGRGPTVFQEGESISGHCVKKFLDMRWYRPAEGCRLIYQGPVDPTRLPGPVGKVTCVPVGYDQPPEDYEPPPDYPVPPDDYVPPYEEDVPYIPGTQPPTVITVPGAPAYPEFEKAGFPTWAIVAVAAAVLLPMFLGKRK